MSALRADVGSIPNGSQREGPDTPPLTPVTKACSCRLAKEIHYHCLYYEAAGALEMPPSFYFLSALLAGIFIIAVHSHLSAGIIISHILTMTLCLQSKKILWGPQNTPDPQQEKMALNAEPITNALMKLEVKISRGNPGHLYTLKISKFNSSRLQFFFKGLVKGEGAPQNLLRNPFFPHCCEWLHPGWE